MNHYTWNQMNTMALRMILPTWLMDLFSAACRHQAE